MLRNPVLGLVALGTFVGVVLIVVGLAVLTAPSMSLEAIVERAAKMPGAGLPTKIYDGLANPGDVELATLKQAAFLLMARTQGPKGREHFNKIVGEIANREDTTDAAACLALLTGYGNRPARERCRMEPSLNMLELLTHDELADRARQSIAVTYELDPCVYLHGVFRYFDSIVSGPQCLGRARALARLLQVPLLDPKRNNAVSGCLTRGLRDLSGDTVRWLVCLAQCPPCAEGRALSQPELLGLVLDAARDFRPSLLNESDTDICCDDPVRIDCAERDPTAIGDFSRIRNHCVADSLARCQETIKEFVAQTDVGGLLDYLAKNCDASEAWACYAAGFTVYVGGQAAPSRPYHGRACELGFVHSCTILGIAGRLGEDLGLVHGSLENACSGGVESACYEFAGLLLHEGDVARSDSYFGKACRQGHAESCNAASGDVQNPKLDPSTP